MRIIALKLLILLEMTAALPVFAKDPPKVEEKGKSAETAKKGADEPSTGGSSQLKSLPGGYVHKWTKIPSLKGYDLSGGTVLLEPVPGKLTVIMFMASWCVPCQDMIAELRDLDKKYAPYGVNFYYAFSHDMPTDVRGFVRERKISPERTSLITDESLKDFRDPLLPTIYLADRKGWIMDRFTFEKNSRPNLSDFKEKLKGILLF